MKSRTSSRRQRRGQHAKFQPVLTVVARAAQVKQDRAADAVHQPPQPTIPNAQTKEPAVPEQPQEADQKGQPSSPHAPERPEQINDVKADTNRFGTSNENKDSERWEEDTISRVRTAAESIEETLQRFSTELDAELQEVDTLLTELDAKLQEVDMEADPTLEEYVEIGKRETDTTMSRPAKPGKSRVPVEPSRSRVPSRWPRQAVASRSRVMGRRSWQSGHVPKHYNTPKVQPIKKSPPEINKTIHNPEKVRGTRYQTTPRKGVLDIGYWRYPYPDHGVALAPFRHGRHGVREKPFGRDLIPHD